MNVDPEKLAHVDVLVDIVIKAAQIAAEKILGATPRDAVVFLLLIKAVEKVERTASPEARAFITIARRRAGV